MQAIQFSPINGSWNNQQSQKTTQAVAPGLFSATSQASAPLASRFLQALPGMREARAALGRLFSLTSLTENNQHPSLMENILKAPETLNYLARYAAENKLTPAQAEQRFKNTFTFITSPDPLENNKILRQLWLRFGSLLNARSFSQEMICNSVNLDKLKQLNDQGKTLIMVPNHTSNLDFPLFSIFLHKNGIRTPFIIGGKNMDICLLGPVLRQNRILFIERGGMDGLYRFVLRKILETILVDKKNLFFFPEGTRNRSGLIGENKMGILRYLWDAVSCNQEIKPEDVYIVPFHISYPRNPEILSYLNEHGSSSKKPESCLQFSNVIAGLSPATGSATFNIAAPFSLQEFATEHGDEIKSLTNHKDPHNSPVSKLARRIREDALEIAPVNSQSLIALALLRHQGHVRLEDLDNEVRLLSEGFSDEHLTQELKDLRDKKINMAGLIERNWSDYKLAALTNDKAGSSWVKVDPQKMFTLHYYGNQATPQLRACLKHHVHQHFSGNSELISFLENTYGLNNVEPKEPSEAIAPYLEALTNVWQSHHEVVKTLTSDEIKQKSESDPLFSSLYAKEMLKHYSDLKKQENASAPSS